MITALTSPSPLLLACDSRDATWDAITGEFEPDRSFLDRALGQTFGRCNLDPARIVVEGFSDGASYCLALGLANGDLFSRVVGFSPGFIPPSNSQRVGKPEFFVSHGQHDPILPIDTTSRRMVPPCKAWDTASLLWNSTAATPSPRTLPYRPSPGC